MAHKSNHRYSRAAIAGIALAALTIPAYFFVSYLSIAAPPTQSFNGWIAVLESRDAGFSIRTRLSAVSDSLESDHPRLQVGVLVCGPSPTFNGVMLFADDARLSDATMWGWGSELHDVSPRPAWSGFVGSEGGDVSLSNVQFVDLRITDVPACSGSLETDARGARLVVEGYAQAPIAHGPPVVSWLSPRTSQTWPVLGGVGNLDPSLAVSVQTEEEGAVYRRPSEAVLIVNGGPLPTTADVEQGSAKIDAGGQLRWVSTESLLANAVIVDTDAKQVLEAWVVALAIAFGIGGSSIAALLLERPREAQPRALSDPPAPRRARNPWLLIVVFAFGALLARRRR